MTIDAATAAGTYDYKGQRYYFCHPSCRERFAADPESFLAPAKPPAPAPAGTIYTCPMHPEIRQDHPGACPKCGMALEPVMPDLEASDENPELKDFSRRFWWTLPSTVVVTFMAMAGHGRDWFAPGVQPW